MVAPRATVGCLPTGPPAIPTGVGEWGNEQQAAPLLPRPCACMRGGPGIERRAATGAAPTVSLPSERLSVSARGFNPGWRYRRVRWSVSDAGRGTKGRIAMRLYRAVA